MSFGHKTPCVWFLEFFLFYLSAPNFSPNLWTFLQLFNAADWCKELTIFTRIDYFSIPSISYSDSNVVTLTTELILPLCHTVQIIELGKQKKTLSVNIFLILEAWRIATSKVHFPVNYGFSRNIRTCKRCPKRNDLNYITLIWRPHYIPSCQRSDKILYTNLP